MDTDLLLLSMLVIFLAGVAQSITGFGFGLVAVPLMTLFLEPSVAVPIIVIEGLLVNLLILARGMQHVQLRRMSLLSAASLAGVPLGVWMLAELDAQTLRIYIGGLMLLAGSLFLAGFRRQVSHEVAAGLPVGFSSGLLAGSISMPGPPIILFFANQGMDRDAFRNTLVFVITAQLVLALPLYANRGLLPAEALVWSAQIFPALLVGGFIGLRLSRYVGEALFRRLTLLTVLAAGVLSLATGLGVF